MEHNTFLKDGHQFRYISGSIHYQRMRRVYWMDRLLKAKAMGVDTIQTYVPWNYHEPVEGTFVMTGERDLIHFIELVQSLDLLVILRVGPYICAEWDFGGLPAWLLGKNATMNIRSSDSGYLSAVKKWFDVLLPMVKPLLYHNGGPIIMIQLENEYGAYSTCDAKYLAFLYEHSRSWLGEEIVLFTTDGNRLSELQCGAQDRRMFAMVDFGTVESTDLDEAFAALRKFQPLGPLVNSEYYTGWPDRWGDQHNLISTEAVVQGLEAMLKYENYSVSVNLYMLHGGSTFGYWNGADSDPYDPFVTSYDYDAPITEAGDTGHKYYALKDIIMKFKPHIVPSPPSNVSKAAYGLITMHPRHHILDLIRYGQRNMEGVRYPPTMEEAGCYLGNMAYITNITVPSSERQLHLKFDRIADSAYLYLVDGSIVNAMYLGMLNRSLTEITATRVNNYNQLVVVVANEGRINYGSHMYNEVKGIIGNLTVNDRKQEWWSTVPLDLSDLSKLLHSPAMNNMKLGNFPSEGSIYQGDFHVEEAKDTFVKLIDFKKGEVCFNDFHLGRHWTSLGPQRTLYVPKDIISINYCNVVWILEWSTINCNTINMTCYVESVDMPIIGAIF